jgi:hypothetical protein
VFEEIFMSEAFRKTVSPCDHRWQGYCLRYLIAQHVLEAVRRRLSALGETGRNGQGLQVISSCAGPAILDADPDEAHCRAFEGLPCRFQPDGRKPSVASVPTRDPQAATPSSRSGPASRRRCGSRMLSEKAWEEIARRLRLLPEDLYLIKAVLDEWKDKKIARRLNISDGAVHAHFRRLYARLRVSSRVGLVRAVLAEVVANPPSDLTQEVNRNDL